MPRRLASDRIKLHAFEKKTNIKIQENTMYKLMIFFTQMNLFCCEIDKFFTLLIFKIR